MSPNENAYTHLKKLNHKDMYYTLIRPHNQSLFYNFKYKLGTINTKQLIIMVNEITKSDKQ